MSNLEERLLENQILIMRALRLLIQGHELHEMATMIERLLVDAENASLTFRNEPTRRIDRIL